jgi:hypothetical protein
VTSRLVNDPAHWRERAAEARRMADQMTDPVTQRVMLGIADDYDRIAERAQRRAMMQPRED